MVIKLEHVKIGSDPEVFLKNNKEVVSSIGLIEGTKREPHDIGNNCGIQTDNVLAEYTFPPVKLDESKKFFDYIRYCIDYTNNYLKKQDVKVSIQSSAYVDEKYLQDPQTREAGCSPDFNVWSRSVNEPADYINSNLRTAGCHIHIGYEGVTDEISEEIVKVLDLFLAIPSLFIDKDTERRKMYGKAGCFRFKDYGVEYRVLGNFILQDQDTVDWLFRNIKAALEFINSGAFVDHDQKNIVEAINTNNLDLAKVLVDKYSLEIDVKEKQKI